jgi:MFS family permease
MAAVIEPVTPPAVDPHNDLLSWIRHKRAGVENYLTSALSRRRLLLNLTIIAGTCAAVLTTAPALGGKSMADWLTVTFGLSSPSWRLLCGLAAVCSLTATLATQLLKAHNLEERITRAQNVRSRLEILEVSMASRDLNYAQAVDQYMACIKDTSFLQGI